MAKLKTADRKAMPKSEFGVPGSKKYPMPDRSHAGNAKARASQQVAKGNLSKSSEKKIDAKANKILGETGDKKSAGAARSKALDKWAHGK